MLAYIDFDTKLLHKGDIHCPMKMHVRKICIEQKDKVQTFPKEAVIEFKGHNIRERVFKLAVSFCTRGPTKLNISKYQQLNQEIKEIELSMAKKVGRKKFGYMRSDNLTICGRLLIYLP